MKSHSMGLRKRVIAAVDNKEGSQREIGRRYKVSLSFIVRLLQHRRNTGSLEPSLHGGARKRALDYRDRLRLGQLIREHSNAPLEQLRDLRVFDCCLRTLSPHGLPTQVVGDAGCRAGPMISRPQWKVERKKSVAAPGWRGIPSGCETLEPRNHH